ncbi:MAG: RlmE family RNA methyltransferase [Sandaracinus sp.]|nr:RlmE family RNA methyltransferase [Sandaracinus sp.]MCB9619718.1 RlmE family RNA methyltransferase [Sandaracinus sp.]MCB9635236.1 RlmE family RNA methyltransferase [Sandaracinus sp.]
MGRRQQDRFGKRARREGFPARSVYKLEEIDRRVQLLKPGMNVLDLGAAPGSWTLYASQKVGKKGRIMALDLHELHSEIPPNVEFRVCDAREQSVESLGGPFDVVLSDMAPKTMGTRSADQYRSYELFLTAVEIAARTAKIGGSFVGKIFQGAEFEAGREALRKHFAKVRVLKPEAVREESYELFLVGIGRREVSLGESKPAEPAEPSDEAADDPSS